MPQKPESKSSTIDIEKILRILPHRYPFLLVDRVLNVDNGRTITALKNVTYNEPFFSGHFPEYRVMPGVLVLEALAQTGGILLYHSIPEVRDKLVFLSKIDNAKFRRPVVPGDQLILEAIFQKMKARFCSIDATAKVDGEVVAECHIMAYFSSLENGNG